LPSHRPPPRIVRCSEPARGRKAYVFGGVQLQKVSRAIVAEALQPGGMIQRLKKHTTVQPTASAHMKGPTYGSHRAMDGALCSRHLLFGDGLNESPSANHVVCER
jgi:hypothetical protein